MRRFHFTTSCVSENLTQLPEMRFLERDKKGNIFRNILRKFFFLFLGGGPEIIDPFRPIRLKSTKKTFFRSSVQLFSDWICHGREQLDLDIRSLTERRRKKKPNFQSFFLSSRLIQTSIRSSTAVIIFLMRFTDKRDDQKSPRIKREKQNDFTASRFDYTALLCVCCRHPAENVKKNSVRLLLI